MLTSWNIEYWRRVHQLNIRSGCLNIAMESKQIPSFHEAKKFSYNIHCDWLSNQEPPYLGERAHLYFYHFALIMLMNKRLGLTPTVTANFASRHLQIHSSLSCVQPCTVYPCFFCLESIVDKPHQPQGPKLTPRCRDF